MIPLDDRQRLEHVQVAKFRDSVEKSWDAIVRGDLEEGLDLLEKAEETLRAVIKNKKKIVPIRGPKGRG